MITVEATAALERVTVEFDPARFADVEFDPMPPPPTLIAIGVPPALTPTFSR